MQKQNKTEQNKKTAGPLAWLLRVARSLVGEPVSANPLCCQSPSGHRYDVP